MSFKRSSKEIIVIVSCVAAVVLFIILYLACKKKNRTKVRTTRHRQQQLDVPVFILPVVQHQEPVRMSTSNNHFPVPNNYIHDNQNFQLTSTEEYKKQPAYNPNYS